MGGPYSRSFDCLHFICKGPVLLMEHKVFLQCFLFTLKNYAPCFNGGYLKQLYGTVALEHLGTGIHV